MTHAKTTEMLLGALVADAATLGLHWLYDADRIAQIAASQGGECAFTPLDPANYADVSGYYAHGARCDGMSTQYGEVLRLAIRSMAENDGAFDAAAYQSAFAAHFGPGGAYQGYIDRPTRGALENIAAEKSPSGVDDDQLPAIARLPAILAAYHGRADLPTMVEAAMQVTNVNDVAAAYGAVATDLLSRVMGGEALASALDAAANAAEGDVKTALLAALSSPDDNSTSFAGEVGRACHLPTAGPVIFHILKRSGSYREAVERNILAGGDSAGRSVLIGAVMGHLHGIATETGIPVGWILRLEGASDIWQHCEALARI